jgi:hypothetical protein
VGCELEGFELAGVPLEIGNKLRIALIHSRAERKAFAILLRGPLPHMPDLQVVDKLELPQAGECFTVFGRNDLYFVVTLDLVAFRITVEGTRLKQKTIESNVGPSRESEARDSKRHLDSNGRFAFNVTTHDNRKIEIDLLTGDILDKPNWLQSPTLQKSRFCQKGFDPTWLSEEGQQDVLGWTFGPRSGLLLQKNPTSFELRMN